MKRNAILATVTALMLTATLLASRISENRKPEDLTRPLERIPTKIGEWTAYGSNRPTDRELELLAATSFLDRLYKKPGRALDLWIAYYALQKAGDSMHTPRNCLPGAGWEISKFDSAEVRLGSQMQRINKFSVRNGDDKALVLYWYQTKDRIISDEYQGKAFLVWDAITKGRTNGSVVKITLADNTGAAEDALGFAAAMMSEMQINFGR